MEDWSAELNELEQRLVRAWIDRDRETIEAILSDDWAVIDPGGRLLTKAQVMKEAFESGEREIEAGQIDDVRVRTFGEVAVVTGKTSATGTYKGMRATVKLRFTDVCVRRGDGWQVVASQATLLSEGQ
jgi:ketosteroid isomerase-like protein